MLDSSNSRRLKGIKIKGVQRNSVRRLTSTSTPCLPRKKSGTKLHSNFEKATPRYLQNSFTVPSYIVRISIEPFRTLRLAVDLKVVYTMKHEVGPRKRAFFNGPTFMVRLLKKKNLKDLGPSLSKRVILKRKENLSLIIFVSFLGLQLSLLLVKCVEDVPCKSSHDNLYKRKQVI